MILKTIRTAAITVAMTGLFAGAAIAQDSVATLFKTLGLPDMIQIMHEEGIVYGAEIGDGIFQGNPSDAWRSTVAAIYDVEAMQQNALRGMAEALEGDDIASMQDFFSSELGARIITLEIAARRALLDDAVETASKEVAALAIADKTPRYQMVTEFIDANDLIEVNVAGALNSNFAFYKGLMQGGALDEGLSEADVLTNLWGQEPEIRQNTIEWVYAYSLLAYQPLPDADLQTYIAFAQTDAGQDLNAAMFAAFDEVFNDISLALGLATTQVTISEEL